MLDKRRQLLNVIFAILQAAAPLMPLLGLGVSVGDRDGIGSPLEVPAGYAFSIWGVIFLLGLIYAVQQALPDARTAKLYREIGDGTWVLFALSTVWMVIAQLNGPNGVLAVIIVVMLVLALRIIVLAAQMSPMRGSEIVIPLAGLYAGWLTLAAPLNISSVLRDLGVAPLGLSEWLYASIVLLVGAAIAIGILLKLRGLFWYAAAAIWGLVAVAVKTVPQGSTSAHVGYVAAALVVALGIVMVTRRRT